ncbi:MAG: metal ABC transporter solute-binding protein, Zn/Mn family [Methanomassiliicoccales archaeon]
MNRKQLILVISSFVVVIILIFASSFFRDQDGDDDKTKVVATFYPLAYMAQSIGGDRVSVTSMVPYNSELHSWQPAPQDIIRADDANVILYNGGPADRWLVDDVLPAVNDAGKVIVNTTAGVSYIAGGDEDEGGTDPHTWLSPKRAMLQARNVYDALCEADSEGEEYFTARFTALNVTLASLDEQYRSLDNSTVSGVIVSHSALGYVAYDYNFAQYGVIGLSADEEPSAAAIAGLVEIMENESIYTVYVDPVYNQNYANILKQELESRTGQDVAVLEMFLTLGPYEELDYLEQLSQNLANLKIGLGVAQ